MKKAYVTFGYKWPLSFWILSGILYSYLKLINRVSNLPCFKENYWFQISRPSKQKLWWKPKQFGSDVRCHVDINPHMRNSHNQCYSYEIYLNVNNIPTHMCKSVLVKHEKDTFMVHWKKAIWVHFHFLQYSTHNLHSIPTITKMAEEGSVSALQYYGK